MPDDERIGDLPPAVLEKYKNRLGHKSRLGPMPHMTRAGTPEPGTTAPEHVELTPEVAPGMPEPAPTLPPRRGQKGFELEGATVGGMRLKSRKADTEATRTLKQEQDMYAEQAYQGLLDSHHWFMKRIAPRLDDLGTGGWQGFAYAVPNFAALMPDGFGIGPIDPDVEMWFAGFGPIATNVNKAYAGRTASAKSQKEMVKPHIPTPPDPGWKSGWDALSTVNLLKYDDYLRSALHALGIITGRVKAADQNYQELPKGAIPLPSGAYKTPSGEVYLPPGYYKTPEGKIIPPPY